MIVLNTICQKGNCQPATFLQKQKKPTTGQLTTLLKIKNDRQDMAVWHGVVK